METKRFVQLAEEVAGYDADPRPDTLDGDRPDLFRLGLGIDVEAGPRSCKQNLERVDAERVECP